MGKRSNYKHRDRARYLSTRGVGVVSSLEPSRDNKQLPTCNVVGMLLSACSLELVASMAWPINARLKSDTGGQSGIKLHEPMKVGEAF